MRNARKRNAFSLLELLAVVTILGIIAAMVIPRVTASATTAKHKVNEQNKSEINAAVERYYVDNGAYPANDMSNMVPPTTYNYLPQGIPINPLTGLADYALDGTTHRAL